MIMGSIERTTQKPIRSSENLRSRQRVGTLVRERVEVVGAEADAPVYPRTFAPTVVLSAHTHLADGYVARIGGDQPISTIGHTGVSSRAHFFTSILSDFKSYKPTIVFAGLTRGSSARTTARLTT